MSQDFANKAEYGGGRKTLGLVSVVYRVDCPHPSGKAIDETGVNSWWFDTEADAQIKALQVGGTIQRRECHRVKPAGRKWPVEKYRWFPMKVNL